MLTSTPAIAGPCSPSGGSRESHGRASALSARIICDRDPNLLPSFFREGHGRDRPGLQRQFAIEMSGTEAPPRAGSHRSCSPRASSSIATSTSRPVPANLFFLFLSARSPGLSGGGDMDVGRLARSRPRRRKGRWSRRASAIPSTHLIGVVEDEDGFIGDDSGTVPYHAGALWGASLDIPHGRGVDSRVTNKKGELEILGGNL